MSSAFFCFDYGKLIKKVEYEGTTNSGGGFYVEGITGISRDRFVSVRSNVADIFHIDIGNGFVIVCYVADLTKVGEGFTSKGTLYYI